MGVLEGHLRDGCNPMSPPLGVGPLRLRPTTVVRYPSLELAPMGRRDPTFITSANSDIELHPLSKVAFWNRTMAIRECGLILGHDFSVLAISLIF